MCDRARRRVARTCDHSLVKPDVKELFSRIQNSALDRNVPLTETLRLCIALGGRLGSPELTSWAEAELDGYTRDDELPEYRKLRAPLKMNYVNGLHQVTGQEVTPFYLDASLQPRMNDVTIGEPISALEAFLSVGPNNVITISATGRFAPVIFRKVLDNEFLSISAVYWEVSQPAIAAILDRVRTRLVSMVAKFDAEVSKPGASAATAAQQAINVVAERGATVHVTNSGSGDAVASSGSSSIQSRQTPQTSDSSSGGWWNWWKTTAAIVVSVLGLAFAYLAIPGIQEIFSR